MLSVEGIYTSKETDKVKSPHMALPCSSLLAAARSMDEVLPASTKGVPGRLFPCELLAEPLRSLFGGVFFFCEGVRRMGSVIMLPCSTQTFLSLC